MLYTTHNTKHTTGCCQLDSLFAIVFYSLYCDYNGWILDYNYSIQWLSIVQCSILQVKMYCKYRLGRPKVVQCSGKGVHSSEGTL